MKLALFVQARINSTRFPRKILYKINNETILEILLKKLKKIKIIDKIVVVMPNTKDNDELEFLVKKLKFDTFRGSEKNVLDRFYKAAKKFRTKNIIRITADCPLVDIKLIEKFIKKYYAGNYNYASNTMIPTYPDAMDIEIFKFTSLEKAWKNAKSSFEKEHVTPYLKKKKLNVLNFRNRINQKGIRITLDHKDDFELIKRIFNHFKPNIYFGLKEIIELRKKFPGWFDINRKYNLK